MPLRLSATDVKRFETASTTLLSALEFDHIADWGARALSDCRALLGADKGYLALPTQDSGLHVACDGDRTPEGRDAYLGYYHQLDVAMNARRVERRLEVYHRDMLYEPGELRRDTLHNEWSIPTGLHDALGMGIQVDNGVPLPALLHLYHERSSRQEFGERGIMLMQLLLPSFKAGVHAWRALFERRAGIADLDDRRCDGVALIDARGDVTDESPQLAAFLKADPEAWRVRRQIVSMGYLLASRVRRRPSRSESPRELQPPDAEVVTAAGRYRVRACLASSRLAGGGVGLVFVDHVSALRATPETLRARHGLTRREVDVAFLLAAGYSTSQIALELSVSGHTVRHHTEHVLRKLGVHARAAVAAAISRDAPS